MKRNSLRAFFLGIVLTVSNTLCAQVFPVNATVTVTPPYSPYLSDYVSVGSQKVMINLSLKDLTVPEYACKLRLTIEGVGITIRTKTTFTPQQPFILPGGGAPVLIYGDELGAYFNPASLDFAGITRSDYEKGAKLPEGIYKFTIEALDYYRGTLVSNKGNATLWIILNDPPQLNYPRNESLVQIVNPANIVFSWTPRNTASPNASSTTEYIFRIVEIWPLNGNAYQAFLTQTPLYEVTTTAKQILYTDAEPALLPGRKYAWQVQAVDTEGRDLFKNQGKSEVYVFQFGELLGTPISLEQTAKSIAGFTAAWTAPVSGQIPDQYRVRYALKTDTIPTWYEKITKERWTSIDALLADSSYRVQVRSEYIGQSSEYSAEVIMRTDSAGNTRYACGVETFKQDVNTIPPLKFLFSGDVFSYRNFKITVANFKGANGQYEGTGTMQIPFFSNANVKVKFSGEINEKRVMERGEVVSTYNKGSDIDKVIEDAKNIGKDKKTNDPKKNTAPVAEITHVIAGIIDEVYINDKGEIVVKNTNGEEEKFERPLDSLSREHNVVKIVDAEGTTYTVDKEGNITKTAAQVLVFEKGNGVFGFDQHQHAALAAQYKQTEDQQKISWKAVTSYRPDVVSALLKGSKYDPKDIHFEIENDEVMPASFSDGRYSLSLIGKTQGTEQMLIAFHEPGEEEKKKEVGHLNVVSYDQISKNLVIVPVNNTTLPSGVTVASVTTKLSEIYDQAVMNWKVSMAAAIKVDLDKTFNDGESGILSNYSPDMRKVINAYGTLQDETYYIFLVNEPASGIGTLGFMPRSKQAGFIYVTNNVQHNVDIVQTIAHELGHGAFNLQHTFKEFGDLTEGETKNLMDYTQGQGTELYKYQWDHIHSPVTVLGLFEDDVDAASIVKVNRNDETPYIYVTSKSNEISVAKKNVNTKKVTRYYNAESLKLPSGTWTFGYEKDYVKIFKIEEGVVAKGVVVRSDIVGYMEKTSNNDGQNNGERLVPYNLKEKAEWSLYKDGVKKAIESFKGDEFTSSYLKPGNYKLTVEQPFYTDDIAAISFPPLDAGKYRIGESKSTDQACTIDLQIIDNPALVTFEIDEAKGIYGFDAPDIPERVNSKFYEKEKMNDVEYEIPWLSMRESQSVVLIAKYNYTQIQEAAKKEGKIFSLSFRSETQDAVTINGLPTFTVDGNTLKVGVNTILLKIMVSKTGVSSDGFVKLTAFAGFDNETKIKVGQLNVISRPDRTSHCVLVKVDSKTSQAASINTSAIKKSLMPFLNERSFNQAFVKWIISEDELVLSNEQIEGLLDKADDTLDKLVLAYVSRTQKWPGHNIIFIIDRDLPINSEAGEKNGYGRLGYTNGGKNGTYSVIFFSAREKYESYVHELGHNFGLGHLTEDYKKENNKSTYNFMSYAPVRYMFWKDQWEKIYHNADDF